MMFTPQVDTEKKYTSSPFGNYDELIKDGFDKI